MSHALSHVNSNRRWRIGILLGAGVLVNYFDRSVISVSAPQLQTEFGFDAVALGFLFSAFNWSYSLLQIPAGLVLDRFGVTLVGRIGALLWTIASSITALASGYLGIFAARLVLGVAEAPGFPGNAKATGYWFPNQERGLATALFDAAAKFSNVIGVPLVGFVTVQFGWRGAFLCVAGLSFAYFIAFALVYRDPSKDAGLDPAELAYIREGGATPEGQSSGGAAGMLGYVIGRRKVWGLTIGFACYGYSFALFSTWLPNYFVREMHMSILSSATFTTIPWMFATVSDLFFGGWLIDHLITRGYDPTRVRKSVLVIGMLTGCAIFGAGFTTDQTWAIVWLSISLSGLAAAAPAGWSIPSLIAPRGGTGTIGGVMNWVNAMMGVVAPIATGYIVGLSGSFAGAFIVAGIVLAVGIAAYVFMLGRIEPIPDPPPGHRAAQALT
jgi:MFS transporter, ACS family, D-galactonate transporter